MPTKIETLSAEIIRTLVHQGSITKGEEPSEVITDISDKIVVQFPNWDHSTGKWILDTDSKNRIKVMISNQEGDLATHVIPVEDLPSKNILAFVIRILSSFFGEKTQRETRLKQLVPVEKINEVFNTIKKALESEGGTVQIFDSAGNVLVHANNEKDAEEALIHLLESDMSSGIKSPTSFIGTKACMVSLKKDTDNLPVLTSTFLTLTKDLDLKKEKDRIKYYKLKEMSEKGFTSEDLRQLAKEAIEEKGHDLTDSNKPIGQMIGRKLGRTGIKERTKVYSLKDLEKLKKFAKSKYL
jgi:hypothetical protein